MEEWNDGTLEYWVEKDNLRFLTLFHHSIIPELSLLVFEL
jgi:hypothetical protein